MFLGETVSYSYLNKSTPILAKDSKLQLQVLHLNGLQNVGMLGYINYILLYI